MLTKQYLTVILYIFQQFTRIYEIYKIACLSTFILQHVCVRIECVYISLKRLEIKIGAIEN